MMGMTMWRVMSGLAVTLVALGAGRLSFAAEDSGDAKTAAQRLEALKKAGAKATIAILPVLLGGQPNRMVGEAVGLTLEKAGLEALDIADGVFTPPADIAWEKMPAELGAWIQKNPPKTDYVLLAEFVGTPQTGPKEVRFIVADKSGALVLSDRQTPADADFKRTAGADPDPMGCSVCVAERVKKLLDLPEVKEPTGGKFEKLWAEKSGLPPAAEREAIEKAQAQLKTKLHGVSVCVYPPLVNGAAKAEQAAHLADAVAKVAECKATAAATALSVSLQMTPNEQKRLWDFARAVRAQVKDQKPDADYVVAADYLIKPDEPRAGVHSVHFVICDRAGEWVVVDFQNDQWDDFKAVAPKTLDDCDQLVAKRLSGYLK